MPRALDVKPHPYWRNGHKTHDTAKSHHPIGTDTFVAIDGEGVTDPDTGEHRYVLLGVGDEQIDNPAGLEWREIFDFMYSRFAPRTAFVGFYLGYDFTQWLKTWPEGRARQLLTAEGREARRSKSPALRGKFLPVDLDEWQFDVLGSKRLSFRRKPCDCPTVKCGHDKGPWMYVCDAGGFFQTSFLNTINPANWQHPIVSDQEFEIISRGKLLRSSATLDTDMRRYNVLENRVMERVMHDLNDGLRKLDVALTPSQWYGPGQAAQVWMRGRAPSRKEVQDAIPEWFIDAARASYFGGWFELMAHGHVPGVSYESDINNAYPHIIANLPCLLHGTYSRGSGSVDNPPAGAVVLVRALVWGRSPYSDQRNGVGVGAMLHRDRQGRISRPIVTSGWYWQHELDAARRANTVRHVDAYEYVMYEPCPCLPPLRQVRHLYQMRLDVGKKSTLGKAAKLTNNSIYGKTAQSVGMPQYANPVYASLITAGCRTMILDAIATHPEGKNGVLMVATDAVFFRTPHPALTYGTGLGEWEAKERFNLTLFKPGVYWDDEARAKLADGGHPNFKARGINARDFAGTIAEVDEQFARWGGNPPPVYDVGFNPAELHAMGLPAWPRVTFRTSFAMVTCLQALIRNDWSLAGTLAADGDGVGKVLVQNANPWDKRASVWYDAAANLYRSEPHTAGGNAKWRNAGNMSLWGQFEDDFSSVPYEKRFGMEDPFSEESSTLFGVSPDEKEPGKFLFRTLTGAE